jgi:hypothetical protein
MPPFPGFPGFPPAEMLDRMWGMMRLTPFGSAFPGAEPGMTQGFGPSLSMMSDMMTPLTNVEELDKRITDLRAVEQWLKLNLGMLQSAIQALEVQRATLTTLRAFGAFAQAQMSPSATEHASAHSSAARERSAEAAAASPTDSAESAEGPTAAPPGFDASSWWNLLQTQFNQLAQFAMAQPAAAAQAAAEAVSEASEAQTQAAAATARRSTAKRSSGNNSGAGAARSAPRAAKKAPAQPE